MDPAMRVATWNVNSLRSREDVVLDWLEAWRPDVLMLQETKVTDQEFPEDAFGDLDYDVVYHGQRTYNGVAILARGELTDVVRGFPGDPPDADRRLLAATVGGVRFVDVYVPNGQALDSDKYRFKLAWLEQLAGFLAAGPGPDTPLVLAGDFNIAPLDLDVPEAGPRPGELFVSAPERAAFARLLGWGLTDTLRHFQPTAPRLYTWWDYRGGAWERDLGMRIDHILVTSPVLARARAVQVDAKVRGQRTPSDHAPVVLDLD